MFGFLKNANTILYISRDSLSVYSTSLTGTKRFSYDPSVMQFGEIKNEVEFQKITREVLQELLPKPQRTIILLSDDVVYHKVVLAKDMGNLSKVAAQFLAKVPLSQKSIIKTVISKKDSTILFITDRVLVENYIAACESLGWNVMHILPASIVGVSHATVLPISQIVSWCNKILKNHKEVDFKRRL